MTRVLVVDDFDDIAEMVVFALRLGGDEAEAWTSGFGVLLTDEPWRDVDVAVIDLSLRDRDNGDHDGADILRYLREEHPGIRRVLYSGTNPDWTPRGTELRSLADVVVVKAVDIADVLEAVRG